MVVLRKAGLTTPTTAAGIIPPNGRASALLSEGRPVREYCPSRNNRDIACLRFCEPLSQNDRNEHAHSNVAIQPPRRGT
jgi:hypothetical protein